MSKLILILVTYLGLLVTQAVGAQQAMHFVNLNDPKALAELEQNNPVHYRKIVAILSQVAQHDEEEVPHWLQTKFDAAFANYAPLLLTSEPPKRDLSFMLDATMYKARVTLTHVNGAFTPAGH